jgi:hypothetical protein
VRARSTDVLKNAELTWLEADARAARYYDVIQKFMAHARKLTTAWELLRADARES